MTEIPKRAEHWTQRILQGAAGAVPLASCLNPNAIVTLWVAGQTKAKGLESEYRRGADSVSGA